MRLPIVSASLVLFIVALFLIVGVMPETLMWHTLPTTRFWQWVSAHFVHISISHLIWNCTALLLLGGIIEQTSRKVLGLAMVAGIAGVNLYLLSLFQMDAYAGLSGALNALLITALYFLYKQPTYKLASVVTFVLSVVKIAIEYRYDLSLFSNLPWPTVPEAHIAGFIAGFILVLVLEFRLKRLLKSDLISFSYLPMKFYPNYADKEPRLE